MLAFRFDLSVAVVGLSCRPRQGNFPSLLSPLSLVNYFLLRFQTFFSKLAAVDLTGLAAKLSSVRKCRLDEPGSISNAAPHLALDFHQHRRAAWRALKGT